MRAIILRVSIIASLMAVVALAGTMPIFSDADSNQREQRVEGVSRVKKQSRRSEKPLSYRSPGSRHKLMVAADDAETESRILASGAARKVRRYAEYTLIEVADPLLSSLDASVFERARLRDDLNLVMLRRGQIDTTGPEPQLSDELRQRDVSAYSLHMVQLFGPPTQDSMRALEATGAKIISYIPNNAYLVWASRTELRRVRALRDESDVAQWDGPFHPAYKLDSRIKLDSSEQVPVSIAVLDTPEASRTIAAIKLLAEVDVVSEYQTSGVIQVKASAESFRLAEVARMPDVLNIEPQAKMKLHDERANQIVANAVSEETVNNIKVRRPATPGYLAFLNSLGFNSNFDFSIDFSDTGLDIGSTEAAKVHGDFLDATGASRVSHLIDYTVDGNRHQGNPEVLPAHDAVGHGTINASIAAGLNSNPGNEFRDFLNFQYGLGIAPFARVGASKLFDDNANFAANVSNAQFIAGAYRAGARISSNSWGACEGEICNLYSFDSFQMDFLVRDADPFNFGNQSMTIIFSAGNDGDVMNGAISMPGTAKNVITVGASENFRSTDVNGAGLRDGCGVGSTEADNALDVVEFSSGGPVQDGRAKPDLVAPGTHMTGAAPQDPFYASAPLFNLAVCDRYFPEGQTLYTWSSGTSHSTPVVAGGAALALQWLKNLQGNEPSPALVKAFILNSTSYLTGRFAGDDLPGVQQGWGLLNLSRMFENTERIIYDESPARTFTESGGEPFETTGVINDPEKEFRVMLVWTDAPGSPTTNAPYVNQLNLEVVVGGVVYHGNNFSGQYSQPGGRTDFLNNVQGVRLPAGTIGPFVVRVRPTIIAGDGVPQQGTLLDQDFALVVTNGREEPVPVLSVGEIEGISAGVTVTHSNGAADSSLIPGETARISVTVNNESPVADADITSATLILEGGAVSISGYPVIEGDGSAVNATPFQIQVPSNLRCGSVARFQLVLETALGQIRLPVGIRVGRKDSSIVIIDDDVDSGRFKWKQKKGFFTSTLVGNSGTRSYHVEDTGVELVTRQAFLILKKKWKIPENAGNVRLTFFHIFNFEPGYDGGVMEISTDLGATWQDLGSRIMVGGYDGQVTVISSNPLGTRTCWTARGRAGVFSQVVINLDDFAGEKIKLRFVAGFDEATGAREGYTGWFIDDIRLTADNFACTNLSSQSPDLTRPARGASPDPAPPRRRAEPSGLEAEPRHLRRDN